MLFQNTCISGFVIFTIYFASFLSEKNVTFIYDWHDWFTVFLLNSEQKKEEVVEEPADPNTHVYVTAHTRTTITYKKDFVPFTTRLYNFYKSFSEPGAADK